ERRLVCSLHPDTQGASRAGDLERDASLARHGFAGEHLVDRQPFPVVVLRDQAIGGSVGNPRGNGAGHEHRRRPGENEPEPGLAIPGVCLHGARYRTMKMASSVTDTASGPMRETVNCTRCLPGAAAPAATRTLTGTMSVPVPGSVALPSPATWMVGSPETSMRNSRERSSALMICT